MIDSSRRRFVIAATVFTSVVLTPAAFRARVARAQSDGPAGDSMVRLARLLAPYDDVTDADYAEVLDVSLNVMGDSLRDSLAEAERSLDAAAGGDFLAADADTQLSAVASIEDTAWFADVLNAVKLFLYGHAAAWRVMGYEGPSWQFGGYAGRGAGVIDWLPEGE